MRQRQRGADAILSVVVRRPGRLAELLGGEAMKILSAIVALSLALAPAPGLAWNARGHMTVAGIAWERMTPQAQRRAIELLRLNPDFSTWIDRIPAGERDRIAFMEAATWPDDLRGRLCPDHPGPACIRDDGYTPADADSDLNIGYRDRRLRPYWHFKDLPYAIAGGHPEDPFRVNAETQINAFSRSLQDTSLGEEAKSFNLTWLLHIVGDVHQPLHATARFSAAHPRGDNGGNGVVVCKPPPEACVRSGRNADKLHSLWDGAIGISNSVRSARAKADAMLSQLNDSGSFLSHVLAAANVEAPPADWLKESRPPSSAICLRASDRSGQRPVLSDRCLPRKGGLDFRAAGSGGGDSSSEAVE